jgi:quercetin dioxygenase-like cupin family protein
VRRETMSMFLKQNEIEHERFDWGTIGWRCRPANTGAKRLVVMDVTLEPGEAHDFHLHPGQEELITVRQGNVTQYLEREAAELEPGDSVFIAADVVHASFNDGSEAVHLQVVVAPALGDAGYALVDVSGDEPWRSLRRP